MRNINHAKHYKCYRQKEKQIRPIRFFYCPEQDVKLFVYSFLVFVEYKEQRTLTGTNQYKKVLSNKEE